MTISSENRKAGPFSGNGSTTQFPFSFKVFQASDLLVVTTDTNGVETTRVLNTDYTVTLNADQNANPGGTINFPVSGNPLATGYLLTATSAVQALQPTDLTNQGGFYPKVISDALDRLTIVFQQLKQSVGRTVTIPLSDTPGSMQLPGAAQRANMGLAFDSSGNPIAVPSGQAVTDLQNPASHKGVDLVVNAAKKVASISVLRTLPLPIGSDAQTVLVDGTQGGNFYWNAASTAQDDGGIFINPNGNTGPGRWTRADYNVIGPVHAEWWGALPNTGADLSSYVNKALAYLGSFGTLAFGPGTFLFNVDLGSARINIQGAGMNKTTLTSYAAASAPFVIGPNGSWDNMTVNDLTLAGDAGTTTKIGFQFGHTAYQTNDETAGRVYFNHVKFKDLDKCIYRPYGNIGVYVDGCVFDNSNFHIWSKGVTSPIMHAGCFVATRSHFTAAQLAHCYLDSPTSGSGQYEYDAGCIIESNPGFVFFIKDFNDTGMSPGLGISGAWNEANYTAASVTIDGTAYTPGFAYINNAASVILERCALGPITLSSSHVVTKGCFLDALSVTSDSDSTIVHDDAQCDSTKTKTMCRSVNYIARAAGSYGSWFRVPHRRWTSKAYSAKINFQNECTAVINFSGSVNVATVSQTDGTLFTTAQDLTIASGQHLIPATFAVNPNKYYVWFIAYKWMSGGLDANLDVSYGMSLGGGITLNDTDWITIAGVTNTLSLGAASSAAFYFSGPSSGSTTVRLGGMAVCEFSTRQAAMDFLDSLAFPIP